MHLRLGSPCAGLPRRPPRAGSCASLVRGDLSWPQHCRDVIARTVAEFGRVDVLVSNAAYQMTHESLEDIPDDEWGYTFRTNVEAMFHLAKAAVPHRPGRRSSAVRR